MKLRTAGNPPGVPRSAGQGNLTSIERFVSRSLTLPRILVADDDPETSNLLRTVNAGASYDVVAVADGRETFRRLQTDADFSLAIFNMAMPHLKGVELLEYMKTEKRLMRIPVIVVSDARASSLVAEAFGAGALASLPKPLNVNQLQMIISLVMSARQPYRIGRAA